MAHRIAGTVAFVSGANRGIGAAQVEALLERGARRVYASARRLESLQWLVDKYGDRVVPVQLDVTSSEQVAAAVTLAPDVTLLVNNAGIVAHQFAPMSDTRYLPALREELETNVVGLHSLTLAFLPVLQATPGAAVVNFSSVAGLSAFAALPTYSASKAAVHSLTQAWRVALAPHGITVHGVYPGPVDTDMARDIPLDKTSAADVANAILDGVEKGIEDILPDPFAAQIGAAYFADPKALERQFASQATAA